MTTDMLYLHAILGDAHDGRSFALVAGMLTLLITDHDLSDEGIAAVAWRALTVIVNAERGDPDAVGAVIASAIWLESVLEDAEAAHQEIVHRAH